MSDPRFTESGSWIIGAETANPIPQNQFPPDIVQLVDVLTARKYWPYLPYIDLDYMELHHPGSKNLINDLKKALHEEWDMLDGWTGLVNSGTSSLIIRRVLEPIRDPELASFCEGITQDLLLWAMNDERVSMEGRAILKRYNVQHPDALLSFPYSPAELSPQELDTWHSELRHNYLHWLIRNAVDIEQKNLTVSPSLATSYKAVRDWLTAMPEPQV